MALLVVIYRLLTGHHLQGESRERRLASINARSRSRPEAVREQQIRGPPLPSQRDTTRLNRYDAHGNHHHHRSRLMADLG